MPRYVHVVPGTPDRQGVNPFTKELMLFKGRPEVRTFWEVEQRGAELRTASGREGGQVRRCARTHVDSEAAARAMASLIASRIARGFGLVGDSIALRAPEATSTAAPLPPELLGKIAPSVRLSFDAWADDAGPPLAESLYALLIHPDAHVIRELVIGMNRDEQGASYDQVIAAIGQAAPPSLEKLFIGDFHFPDEIEISWANVGDCEPLWALTSLRELTLQGAGIELGSLDWPHLERLEIRTGGLGSRSIEALMAGNLPALRVLHVWFGSSSYGAEGRVDDLASLFEGSRFPALRDLGLQNAEFTDEACEPLLASRVLRQLERLDLSMGTLTDAGAKKLKAGAAALSRLHELDVRQSYLTRQGIAMLRGVCAVVRANDQRTPHAHGRYVSVGE